MDNVILPECVKRELEKEVGNREGRRLQERMNDEDSSQVNDIKIFH